LPRRIAGQGLFFAVVRKTKILLDFCHEKIIIDNDHGSAGVFMSRNGEDIEYEELVDKTT